MNDHAFSDEILMAYADGELDDATAQHLLAALPNDAALASRLALFSKTRAALTPHSPPDAIPDALMARVRATLDAARQAPPDTVVPFARPAAPLSAPVSRWQPMALAAGLALVIGLGAGFWSATQMPGARDAAPQSGPFTIAGLGSALSDMASGESRILDGGTVTIVTSFLTADNEFCREIEFAATTGDSFVSLVCRTPDDWRTRLAVVTGGQDGATFAPAASLDTIDAYLSSVGATAPLSPVDEASALAALRP